MASQEPVVFNGTVLQNVKMGLLGTAGADLPEEKQMQLVEEACRSAYAHEFIEHLPEVRHRWLDNERH